MTTKTQKIIRREPPETAANPAANLTTPLDIAIGSVLKKAKEPMRPVEVADTLQQPQHKVANRLLILSRRGAVLRVRPDNGPQNGPGSSLYTAV